MTRINSNSVYNEITENCVSIFLILAFKTSNNTYTETVLENDRRALSLSRCRQPRVIDIFQRYLRGLRPLCRRASICSQPPENSYNSSCMQMRRPCYFFFLSFSFLFAHISRTGYFYLPRLTLVVYKAAEGFTWDAHTSVASQTCQVQFETKKKPVSISFQLELAA